MKHLSKLKTTLIQLELEDTARGGAGGHEFEELHIFADNLQECLQIASKEFHCDLSQLDYDIIKKGGTGFLGVGKSPYEVMVRLLPEDNRWNDIEDLNISLSNYTADGDFDPGYDADNEFMPRDGRVKIKHYKTGVFLKIEPPQNDGRPVVDRMVYDKLMRLGIQEYHQKTVEKVIAKKPDKYVKVAEYKPKPDADSVVSVEISSDEMKCYITIMGPRPGGRHLEFVELMRTITTTGVSYGIDEELLKEALEEEDFNQTILAAEGKEQEDGKDGFVDFRVRTEKKVEFKETDSGQVDWLNRDLVENVVQGQILAVLIPPEKGSPGRTVTNRILPVKNGKDVELVYGQGTILSEDGTRVIAERNGQVLYKSGRLSVEDIFTVTGDVGLDTGNIMFLGSVQVRMNVLDNMTVKAAGDIEVGGTVEKAFLEAEGDIVIKAGITGRNGGHVQSTAGSVISKFIQSANVSAEHELIVPEGIIHSNVDAGKRLVVMGKKGSVVGGEVIVGEELRCKSIGSTTDTETKIIAGTSPKILRQIRMLSNIIDNAASKMEKVDQNIRTLQTQKQQMLENFPQDKEELLLKMMNYKERLEMRTDEAKNEKEQLKEYMQMLSSSGKIHIEKTLFPKVTIEINGATLVTEMEFTNCTLVEEKGQIKILPYEKPSADDEVAISGRK